MRYCREEGANILEVCQLKSFGTLRFYVARRLAHMLGEQLSDLTEVLVFLNSGFGGPRGFLVSKELRGSINVLVVASHVEISTG